MKDVFELGGLVVAYVRGLVWAGFRRLYRHHLNLKNIEIEITKYTFLNIITSIKINCNIIYLYNNNNYLIINWKFIPYTNLSILFYYTYVDISYIWGFC